MKKERGFTLIELLVVIAIIGLLSSVVMASLNQVRAKARDSSRKQSIIQVRNALELYSSQNGSYPSSNYSEENPSWLASAGNTGLTFYEAPNEPIIDSFASEHNYIYQLVPNYISELPSDPKPGISNMDSESSDGNCDNRNRAFVYASNGIDYKFISLCAMEGKISANDPYADTIRCPSDYCYSYGVWTDGAKNW